MSQIRPNASLMRLIVFFIFAPVFLLYAYIVAKWEILVNHPKTPQNLRVLHKNNTPNRLFLL
jgi:hypothetical protein